MKNYVTVHGTDCDGAHSPSITKYTTEELAAAAAKHSAEWSDGLLYVNEDEEQAKRYAEHYGINLPDYAFDENNDIVHDEDQPPPPKEDLTEGDAWSGGFADNH
jgi:hypothetical protein